MIGSSLVIVVMVQHTRTSLSHSHYLTQHKVTREQLIWFMFQKTKYVYEEGKFKLLEFATDHSYGHYHGWKGYLDDSQVAAARQMYNKNKLGRRERRDWGKEEGKR